MDNQALTTIDQPGTSIAPATHSHVDNAIIAWLDSKAHKSGSSHTAKAYATTIAAFRAYVQKVGLDLDSDTDQLSLGAQSWINGYELAAASKHQKLAIVSSFYKYAIERASLTGIYRNPIKSDMRVKTQAYARVSVITDVAEKLAAIDRTYLDGIRNYALLYLTLMTGRRLNEIASLTVGDITIKGDEVIIDFNRTKGNKSARNVFSTIEIKPLLDYLKEHVFSDTKADNPLWVSYSKNSSNGKALSVRSLEMICTKIMGTNFHSLRHTFAKELESAGAKVSDIQNMLGHASLATTGLYLSRLNDGRNEKASALASKFIKQ